MWRLRPYQPQHPRGGRATRGTAAAAAAAANPGGGGGGGGGGSDRTRVSWQTLVPRELSMLEPLAPADARRQREVGYSA